MSESARGREWRFGAGERAALTPRGPTAALVESRGPLPLRSRSRTGEGPLARLNPGTAVTLDETTYEVVRVERDGASVVYRLALWPRDLTIRDRVVYDASFVARARSARRGAAALRALAPLRLPLEMLSALLPGPERRLVADRLVLDAMRGTLLVGLLQVVACGILLPASFIAFYGSHLEAGRGRVRAEERSLTEHDQARAESFATLSPILFLLSPLGLVLAYGFATGAARLLHSRVAGEPLADPSLALAFWVVRRARGSARRRRRLSELGPLRPDRVIPDGLELLVWSSREKPEWEHATVQVGERFYRVREVCDRPDGRFTALCFRLEPLPEGSVFRNLVRYGPSDGPLAPLGAPSTAQPVASRIDRAACGSLAEASGEAAAPTSRVDDGELARLTPEGPTAALIESRGSLPLRPRSAASGVHHRPEFPGTCVLLRGERYEVVSAEELGDERTRYRLEPWRRECVLRDVVEYAPRLVRAVQRERREAAARQRRSRYGPLVLPFLGLLPEERQLRACFRYGIEPENATIAGAGLEIAVAVLLARAFPSNLGYAAAVAFGIVIVTPAALRIIGALAWHDVAGNPLLEQLLAVRASLPQRLDHTVLPLTRAAFWARLALPDRQRRHAAGRVLVEGLLPHLHWGGTRQERVLGARPTIAAGGELWSVTALPPVGDEGRLTYRYELWVAPERMAREDLPEPLPPDPLCYQREVAATIARQWDAVFALAPWLPTLLPRAVQERAFRERGGAPGARRFTVVSALATLAAAAWFLAGGGPLELATGLALSADGLRRLWLCWRSELAPSLLGPLVAPLLAPERAVYHAHREAERELLLERRAAD